MITVGPGIDDALVLGDWYFKGILIESGASGITDINGVTSIISIKKPAKSGDAFVFTVTDILLDEYTYKPEENIVTQGEISIP